MSYVRDRSVPDPPAGALAPLVSTAGFLVGLALLLRATPVGGPTFEPTLLPGRIPLEVAGADPFVVLASVGVGQSWLYLTGVSALLLAVGTLVALLDVRGGSLLGLVLSSGAAGTLVRVSGCHCGAGSTSYLWELVVLV